jgi:putative intracellular protease/amidase
MSKQRALFVLTSHASLGDTGKPTGFYLAEVTHPYAAFEKAGIPVDFISPQGGAAPLTGMDDADPINQAFLADPIKKAALENTRTPDAVNPADYTALFYAGGHGTMWDFPNTPQLDALATAIYEQGGVIGAVCHGPAGLVNIKLSNGAFLVAGKTVSCFTNAEEAAVGLTAVVPFLLETTLIARGATHTKADNFQAHCVVSERLVTGQNPASATQVGQQMVALLTSSNKT